MVDQPGMSFGGKSPQQWVNDIPQDQLVQLSTSLLDRIAADNKLRDQFTQQVKSNPTIQRMIAPEHTR